MIRRDYILRMIEEAIQALATIRAQKKALRWDEASATLDEEFKKLIGGGSGAVAKLSDSELLARLIEGEPTQAVHQKALLLTSLLKEAGDVATEQDRLEESRACYLKGLHLLLEALGRGEPYEFPEFVPQVEVFVELLAGDPLPFQTEGLLMQHYERTGEFAKAEDALFRMLEDDPENIALLDFGIAFYERLSGQSDEMLAAGELPRPELEAARNELRSRKSNLNNERHA